MWMLPRDEQWYPVSARYLRNDLPRFALRRHGIVEAARYWGEIWLEAALTWGTPPCIMPRDLFGTDGKPVYGRFPFSAGEFEHHSVVFPTYGQSGYPNLIFVNRTIFAEIEAGRWHVTHGSAGDVPLLEVVVMHELMHWGDMQDGQEACDVHGDEIEVGWAFEGQTYGKYGGWVNGNPWARPPRQPHSRKRPRG